MKIHEYNEMMRWLTRPKKQPMKITDYIQTMNRLYGNNSMQDGGSVKKEEKKTLQYDIGKQEHRNIKDPDYPNEATPSQMVELEKRLQNARAFAGPSEEERFNDKILKRDKYEVKPKKKIKKVASSLLTPQKPLPFSLDKWLDEIHPNWWEIEYDKPMDPEEEARKRLILENRNKVAEGIETLLYLRPEKKKA